ncbi:hypothetical protein PoB_001376500 [Plakobranchus ocellatus]|uniref:Uncharacterized protein n=1 Tax=Plakobranchus ocellatus TaxID=259542 RepID=A0AAV3YVL2_9GAST|nr:hypothetical protein PoB_001376500 [Plakobranchus ocellatus]
MKLCLPECLGGKACVGCSDHPIMLGTHDHTGSTRKQDFEIRNLVFRLENPSSIRNRTRTGKVKKELPLDSRKEEEDTDLFIKAGRTRQQIDETDQSRWPKRKFLFFICRRSWALVAHWIGDIPKSLTGTPLSRVKTPPPVPDGGSESMK